MVSLTYVLETPAPVASDVQPVNLAFAAAAAARASWASKEREDNLWDFEPLDDGAVGNLITLADGVLDGSAFTNFVARNTDTGSVQPSQPQRSSGVGQTLGFAAPMITTAALSPDAPGIHEIPRNSVLFRTHAAQQTMDSSLPPAEPNAPTAIEVAAVMEERKSRGFLLLPDEIITPPSVPPPRAPQRSASFSPGLESAAPEVTLAPVEDGSASTGCNTVPAGSHKASYNHPYAAVNGTARDNSPVLSPILDGMVVPGIDDRGTGPIDPDGEGECERDGCLVLPVLRTLLAMQDDSPRSFPPSRPNIANGSLSRLQSLSMHTHGGGHGPHGHNPGGGTQTFAGIGLGASTNVSRQGSVHALRTSPSAALTTGGGVSIGGGVTRQSTSVNNTSPARRRVVVGGSAAAAAAARMDESPTSIMKTPGVTTPRRQATGVRVSLSYPAGYVPGNGPQQEDDELPVIGSSMDPGIRTVLHTASAFPIAPMQSLSHHTNGKYLTRSQVASPLPSSVVGGGGGGAGFGAVAVAVVGTDPFIQIGDIAVGTTATNVGGASSPQVSLRQSSHAAAATIVRAGPVKASQQSPMQQQGVQPPPSASSPLPASSGPSSPSPQANSVKTKPGKALFAWTHKIGKGKWPWFPGGSSNAAAAVATAGTPPSSGPVSPISAASGNSATAGTQELPFTSAHALSGPNADAAAAAAAVLQSTGNGDRQTSGAGSVSGNGRKSNAGGIAGQQQLSQQAAAPAGHVGPKEPVQLPPIELHARRRPTGGGGGGPGEPLSPVALRMGSAVTVGGGGGGGSAFGKR